MESGLCGVCAVRTVHDRTADCVEETAINLLRMCKATHAFSAPVSGSVDKCNMQ